MFVDTGRHGTHLLAYELNVHPGESLRQLRSSLETWTLPIRDKVAKRDSLGIAPRVGRGLLRELAATKSRREFAAYLLDQRLVPTSINAFPLEDFHAARVKERVYSPPWTDDERLELTRQVADLHAELLPRDAHATISTLGGTYRLWRDGRSCHHAIGHNYLQMVRHLIELFRRTGRHIVLAAEPEPDTTFETASDVIELVEDHMLSQVRDVIARPLTLTPQRAEELFREFFTVNLDVCHQSVLFRDPVDEWRQLEAADLSVGKLHITSALALPKPARSRAGYEELLTYDEPRYLHQFAGRTHDGQILRGHDLCDLPQLEAEQLVSLDELRVHFHVPVSKAKVGRLRTTRDDTQAAIQHAVRHPNPPQFVVETYTWPILADQDPDIVDGIAKELRWTKKQMVSA